MVMISFPPSPPISFSQPDRMSPNYFPLLLPIFSTCNSFSLLVTTICQSEYLFWTFLCRLEYRVPTLVPEKNAE